MTGSEFETEKNIRDAEIERLKETEGDGQTNSDKEEERYIERQRKIKKVGGTQR